MSASGLDVFDRTLETTHIWLNEICNDLGPDKQVAWKVLSTVLHKLRDRLTINLRRPACGLVLAWLISWPAAGPLTGRFHSDPHGMPQ